MTMENFVSQTGPFGGSSTSAEDALPVFWDPMVDDEGSGSLHAVGDPMADRYPNRRKTRVSLGPDACRWCLRTLGPGNPNGRRRIYCSQACRQRAYQSRRRSRQLGLDEKLVVVSEAQIERWLRRLHDLEEAVAAVEIAGLHLSDTRTQKLCAAVKSVSQVTAGGPFRNGVRGSFRSGKVQNLHR
jgi:hypothetical protein